ncbi:hypothetical protein NQZ68_032898 [Dissostichus eleginoides]|nr:hypothetical protein NQZ68_032898 [Dissostichus eleginoides]
MALGKKPNLSLFVREDMVQKRLPERSRTKCSLPGWRGSLRILRGIKRLNSNSQNPPVKECEECWPGRWERSEDVKRLRDYSLRETLNDDPPPSGLLGNRGPEECLLSPPDADAAINPSLKTRRTNNQVSIKRETETSLCESQLMNPLIQPMNSYLSLGSIHEVCRVLWSMKNSLPSQSRASSQPAGSGSSSPSRPELSLGIATRLDPLPCVRSRGEKRSRSLHHFQESGGVKKSCPPLLLLNPSGGTSTAALRLFRPRRKNLLHHHTPSPPPRPAAPPHPFPTSQTCCTTTPLPHLTDLLHHHTPSPPPRPAAPPHPFPTSQTCCTTTPLPHLTDLLHHHTPSPPHRPAAPPHPFPTSQTCCTTTPLPHLTDLLHHHTPSPPPRPAAPPHPFPTSQTCCTTTPLPHLTDLLHHHTPSPPHRPAAPPHPFPTSQTCCTTTPLPHLPDLLHHHTPSPPPRPAAPPHPFPTSQTCCTTTPLPHLPDLLHHHTPSRCLRSSEANLLSIPTRIKHRTWGGQSLLRRCPLPLELTPTTHQRLP